jgi:hypothetical protein
LRDDGVPENRDEPLRPLSLHQGTLDLEEQVLPGGIKILARVRQVGQRLVDALALFGLVEQWDFDAHHHLIAVVVDPVISQPPERSRRNPGSTGGRASATICSDRSTPLADACRTGDRARARRVSSWSGTVRMVL